MPPSSSPPSGPTFDPINTVKNGLDQIRAHLPEDIVARYFVGPIWEQLEAQQEMPIGNTLSSLLGPLPAKTYLASFLINVVAQSLVQELQLGQVMDPATERVTTLDETGREAMVEAIMTITKFVTEALRVPVEVEDEVNPIVRIG